MTNLPWMHNTGNTINQYGTQLADLQKQISALTSSNPKAFKSTTPTLDKFVSGLPMMQNAARLNANNPMGGAPTPAQMLGSPTAAPQAGNISTAMQMPQNALPQATQQPQMQQGDVQQKLAQILLG